MEEGKTVGDMVSLCKEKTSTIPSFMQRCMTQTSELGKRYSKGIVEGNIGTYMVSDPQTLVYLVEWNVGPWMADEDGEVNLNGQVYRWRQGDYVC